jgi:hypothetical protein
MPLTPSILTNLPASSQEALLLWVESYADPTGAPITYAIIQADQPEPAPSLYTPAAWTADPVTPNTPAIPGTSVVPAQKGRYLAKLPLGPGSPWPLAPGSRYELYVKLALDGSVHLAGALRTL